MTTVAQLVPEPLWQGFAALNAVPRPSKHEEKASAFVQEFASRLGLPVETDAGGNVLVRKPASPGKENRPPVALQSHLDMVHQKNAGTRFDFEREGIRMLVDGDWVRAEGTTLGADNGIGVGAILALLSSRDLAHPPLEALFTVDEETGMTGAKSLQAGWLQARVLLNLDTEDDRELTIGCAGGVDVLAQRKYAAEAPPAGATWFRLSVTGLTGGHSGMDIHRGRGNANKILGRLLLDAPASLATFDGGGLRNAIPREAWALLAVADPEALKAHVLEISAQLRSEFGATDPGLRIELEPAEPQAEVVEPAFQVQFLRTLQVVPNGIHRMSPEVQGLVQTSNNLARVLLENGEFSAQCLCRGSVDSAKMSHAAAIRCAFELLGAQVELTGEYPGWAPRPEAGIVQLMSAVYEELFDMPPIVTACHAGLECGILGKNYPEMEMISFGPNIRGAHSPEECVQISSVQKFWRLLTTTLERL